VVDGPTANCPLFAPALNYVGVRYPRLEQGRAWGIQPHPEIGVDEGEGRALQASYLRTMSERRDVLGAAWHSDPRDDRIAPALVKGFLNA